MSLITKVCTYCPLEFKIPQTKTSDFVVYLLVNN